MQTLDVPRRPRARRLPRTLSAVATAVAVAAAALGAQVVLPASPASASPATGCHYGTGGPQAESTCWLDFTGFSDATARTSAGQPFSISLPGGYTASFVIREADVTGRTPITVNAQSTPTWGGAYLGQNGHYQGIGGQAALQTTTAVNGGVRLTLSDIDVTDAAGQPVAGFALLAADAESSNGNGVANRESLTFRSDVPLVRADSRTVCGGGLSGIGTTTVTCIGDDATAGNALFVQAVNPATVSIETGESPSLTGMQGVAFAFVHSSVQVDVAVSSRLDASNVFSADITSGSSTVATGTTGSSASGTTGATVLVPASSGTSYGLAVRATSGSMANYDTAWSCTNSASGSATVLPSGAGATQTLVPRAGDGVRCTATLTPKSRGLAITATAAAADRDGDGLTDRGDRVTVTYTVTNTGRTPLQGVTVTDPAAGTVVCAATTLAAGDSTTCTATRDLTAADETTGSLSTSATASGSPASSSTVVTSTAATTTTAVVAADPRLTVALTADRARFAAPGDVVTWTAVVRNTGNVGLAAVAVAPRAFGGAGTAPVFTCSPTTLATGASATCTGTSVTTQADVDSGTVQTDVTAASVRRGGGTGATGTSSAVVVQGDQTASVALQLSPDRTSVQRAGDRITWTFTARNTGTVTLGHVAVAATAFSSAAGLPSVDCAATRLAPGASTTCTATTTTTLADLDLTSLDLSGVLQAQRRDGSSVVSSVASASVAPQPVHDVALVLSQAGEAPVRAGQVLQVRYTATNTGTAVLRHVAIDATRGAAALVCPATDPQLAPGESVVCTASITVTDHDVRAGSIAERATATGTGGASTVVRAKDALRSPLVAKRGIDAVIAAPQARFHAGDTVRIPVTLTASGTVGFDTEDAVARFGGRVQTMVCEARRLAPGDSTRCTITAHVLDADVAAGSVPVTVRAQGAAGSASAAAAVRTVADVPTLAFTGSSALLPVAGGLVAVLAGLVLLVAGRRRRLARR